MHQVQQTRVLYCLASELTIVKPCILASWVLSVFLVYLPGGKIIGSSKNTNKNQNIYRLSRIPHCRFLFLLSSFCKHSMSRYRTSFFLLFLFRSLEETVLDKKRFMVSVLFCHCLLLQGRQALVFSRQLLERLTAAP